ncbi:TetR family transcriptional regulator C-terminal domain-containing protein [Pseudooceanicola sp. LIPI14-2-Ac024]|uniref:TetR family transcriptional regulator C-terminal domain-containing protein n=1 Tax=Pseudooceanicola sp. LIPI14-2-Ac024 TaxID=3344875 RepID=UPI0035D12613
MSRKAFSREPESRRAALIEATLDAVAARGLQGATVRDIAERAGVTNGLIRHYFSGKEEMIQAAYRHTMTTMTDATRAAITDEGRSPGARLRAFIQANLTPPVVDPRTLSLWASFISTIHADPAMAAIHREAYLDFRHTLEALIREVCAAEGRTLDPAVSEGFAIAINGVLDGLWVEGCLAGDLFDPDQLIEAATRSVEAILDLTLND